MLVEDEIFDKPHEPKHRQVREFLLEQIAIGRFKIGDSLPPESVIAKSLGVGRNTVRHAFSELIRQGFISRKQGRLAFVTREINPRENMRAFGLIMPDLRGSLYSSLVKGFSEIASSLRCSLTICETGNDIARQSDAILQMIDRCAVGVAMVPTMDGVPSYQLRQLENRGIPVVLCHCSPDDIPAAVITWSWEEVGRIAATEIVKRGHRRVAFAAGMRNWYCEMQEKAFRRALATHGIELLTSQTSCGAHHSLPNGDASHALTAMLLSQDCPTAIFVSSLDVGERVYRDALCLGLRVPEDLSIVAFGEKWREGLARQQLAVVAVDEVELGRSAAQVLARSQSDHSELNRKQRIELAVEFIAGNSLTSLT